MSERTERYLERAAIVFLVVAALFFVSACDDTVACGKVGDTREEPHRKNAFQVCRKDGKWHRAENPDKGNDRRDAMPGRASPLGQGSPNPR